MIILLLIVPLIGVLILLHLGQEESVGIKYIRKYYYKYFMSKSQSSFVCVIPQVSHNYSLDTVGNAYQELNIKEENTNSSLDGEIMKKIALLISLINSTYILKK